MPRCSRMIIPDEKTCYHVLTRSALPGNPFDDQTKEEFVKIIRKYSKAYFVEVLGFSIMGSYFHLVLRTLPGEFFPDDEIKKRFSSLYGEGAEFTETMNLSFFRNKWSSISKFMQDIKQNFSRYYNKRHKRRGTLWGERFKSVIVEEGLPLLNCLAYVELSPVREKLSSRPDKYRWNSLSYHMRTENKDGFLSFDFGLKEFDITDYKKKVRLYRKFVYEAGEISDSGKKPVKPLRKRVRDKKGKKEITRSDRFRNLNRYFIDSGIIGSKEFVTVNYQRFKHLFRSKHEKKPKTIKGLSGIFSMKRLSEDK